MCEDPLADDIEPQPDTWTTKDGRVLLMSEMTIDHLNNAINFLEGRIEALEELRVQLRTERAKRYGRRMAKTFAELFSGMK